MIASFHWFACTDLRIETIAGSGLWASALQAMVSLDALLVTMSAMVRAAKAARWAEGADPLVLDANGNERAANDNACADSAREAA